MTTARMSLQAKSRDVLGKKVKIQRKEGLIPGSVYGKNVSLANVFVNSDSFAKAWKQAGGTGVVDLCIDDQKPRPVLIHDVSVDPVKRTVLNIAFYQVNLREKIHADVPVTVVGESQVVKDAQGVVMQLVQNLAVEALPTDLPEHIVVDISHLENVGDVVTVGQISLPAGVATSVSEDVVLVQLAPLAKAEAEKTAEVTPAEGQTTAEPAVETKSEE